MWGCHGETMVPPQEKMLLEEQWSVRLPHCTLPAYPCVQFISFVNKVTSVPQRWDLTSAVSAPWPAGKHTASSHRLSALVTPAGKSYECQAQQTISLISSDHQKSVQLLLSEVRIQPFDITADFVFSEGKVQGKGMSCIPEMLTLPWPLGMSQCTEGIWVSPLSGHLPLPPAGCQCSLQSLQPIPCLRGHPKAVSNSAQLLFGQNMGYHCMYIGFCKDSSS